MEKVKFVREWEKIRNEEVFKSVNNKKELVGAIGRRKVIWLQGVPFRGFNNRRKNFRKERKRTKKSWMLMDLMTGRNYGDVKDAARGAQHVSVFAQNHHL